MNARYQFVWWGWAYAVRWPWVRFKRIRHEQTELARIYTWCCCIGPLEIRRWTDFSMQCHRKAKRSEP